MNPKVSVSLITYNHGPFIAETLDSILRQESDFNVEIVIGEDCSTDDTRSVVEDYRSRYPEKIRLLLRDKNVGSTQNFCETLLNCNGRYIAMMDGDDRMLPGKLQKQADFLDSHPDVVMVAHDLREFESETDETLRIVTPAIKREFYVLGDLIREGSVFGNSSKMFRGEALPRPPVDPEIKAIADYYLTLHVLDQHQLGYLQETLGEYRIHPGGLMKSMNGTQILHDIQLTLSSLTDRYGEEYTAEYANMHAYSYLMSGIHHLKENRGANGRRDLIKSLSSNWHYAKGQYFYLISSFVPSTMRKMMFRWVEQVRAAK